MLTKYYLLECPENLSDECNNLKYEILKLNPHIKNVSYSYFLKDKVGNVLNFKVIADADIFSPISVYKELREDNIQNPDYDKDCVQEIEQKLINLIQRFNDVSIELTYLW